MPQKRRRHLLLNLSVGSGLLFAQDSFQSIHADNGAAAGETAVIRMGKQLFQLR